MTTKPYKTHNEKLASHRKPAPPKKVREPSAEQQSARAAQTRLNRMCYQLLGADGGAELLEYLRRKFIGPTVIRKNTEGSVDPFATISVAGNYELFDYIDQMIKLGEKND